MINHLPLAPHPINRDFEAEVLEYLKRHRTMMHGVSVGRVECKIDGGVVIWFVGQRDGLQGEWALRFNFPLLRDKKWLNDTNAVGEVALDILSKISLKADQPLIIKGH